MSQVKFHGQFQRFFPKTEVVCTPDPPDPLAMPMYKRLEPIMSLLFQYYKNYVFLLLLFRQLNDKPTTAEDI
jgi:hypothetical protein